MRQNQDPPVDPSEVMDSWQFNCDGRARYQCGLDPKYMRI